jgi:putative phosphoribosyl transferase
MVSMENIMYVEYADRLDAGRQLADALRAYRDADAIVLGLARGGIVVGFAVAEALHLSLQALVVRKIGAPFQPELAIGAVSETGTSCIDHDIVRRLHASDEYVEKEVARKRTEASDRKRRYAVGPGLEAIRGRQVIIVDDGIATGATAWVAVQSARELGASKIILAIPVASRQSVELLRPHVDELAVVATPRDFFAIGQFYRRFDQVTDEEVVRYLRLAQSATAAVR